MIAPRVGEYPNVFGIEVKENRAFFVDDVSQTSKMIEYPTGDTYRMKKETQVRKTNNIQQQK